MKFAAALASAGVRRGDPAALGDLASAALAEGKEVAALARLRPIAGRSSEARLWQWVALLHRSLDEHDEALAAFAESFRLDPQDASIAHGYARVMLEAGLDARAQFARALQLQPSTDVILGSLAAKFAMGEGEIAARELAAILDRNPLWIQGHVQWSQLSSMIGRPDLATATIDQATDRQPGQAELWLAAIRILASAGRYEEAWRRADQAIAAAASPAPFALPRAAALSDAGELAMAETAFAAMGEPAGIDHAIRLARHLIRGGDRDALSKLVDRWMSGEQAHFFWPYASIVWRQSGDPRWQWLEGDSRLVRTFDLGPKLAAIGGLADRLRELHSGSGRFLDQSVRGGTQTDGPLLSRIDPEIRALRGMIVNAVEEYRRELPPLDSTHPMLRHRRHGRVRFSGSWSVRLSEGGYHSAHVHPQGWISSALYVAVPESMKGEEGWLTLGAPHEDLRTGLPPLRKVEPLTGRLVLFPSMMWHGTLPFGRGERMTVAFDIAPPR